MNLDKVAECTDLLSLSGHKMYGPQGIGALFIRRDLQDQIEPIICGGGQQRNLRSGTVPVALCVGMGAAAELLQASEAQEEREELRRRTDLFVRKIAALPWRVAVNGPDIAQRHPGNANMRFEGFDAHDIVGALQPRLAVSTGSACTSGIPEPSHVLRAIGLSTQDAEASVRFGLGRMTTDEDMDTAVSLIRDALSRLADSGLARTA